MKTLTRKKKVATAIYLLPAIALLGEHYGHYYWFGGTQQDALIVVALALSISLLGCWMLFSRHRITFLVIPLYFLASQILFSFAIALGQVHYAEPETWAEFKQQYSWALQGRL